MTTLTALRDPVGAPSTAERRQNAEEQLARNLGITDSVRERVRTKLIDVPIEDSPIKRDLPRRGRDEQVLLCLYMLMKLLSKIRGGVSPVSSVSSNDSPPMRPKSLLGNRLLSGRHKKTSSSPSIQAYAFPNEYSIPTIPLPPEPSEHESLFELKPPESPPRFRRRDHSSVESTPTKNTTRDPNSVHFELPEDSSDLLPSNLADPSQPITSTPNPSKTQQLLDEEADAFDSAKELISAYQTPLSPPRGTPTRFRRGLLQTPAPGRETPSKLLRTLSRATSVTPAPSDTSIFQTPFPERHEEEVSLDEAEKTLDSIIESADEASVRIRKVLEQSREERALRLSLSPPPQQEKSVTIDETRNEMQDVTVWGEKSFFRRMAMKAPGGWAFTPQPKFRKVDVTEQEDVENIDPVKVILFVFLS